MPASDAVERMGALGAALGVDTIVAVAELAPVEAPDDVGSAAVAADAGVVNVGVVDVGVVNVGVADVGVVDVDVVEASGVDAVTAAVGDVTPGEAAELVGEGICATADTLTQKPQRRAGTVLLACMCHSFANLRLTAWDRTRCRDLQRRGGRSDRPRLRRCRGR
jgi:hypothetical protein